MSCIVWNFRGLGNQRTVRELKRLIADKQTSLLFLCETPKRDINNNQWSYILGYKGCFYVDGRSHGGGLCLCWKDPLDVSIKSFSQGHVDCLVKHDEKQWRAGFYGNPSLRHLSWSLLQRLAWLHEYSDIPCLIGGDFNEICYDRDKLGGNRRLAIQMEAFWEALDNCHYKAFTVMRIYLHNRRQTESFIFERLDRYVSSFAWSMLYPTSKCSSLDFHQLDHRPIFMTLGLSNHADDLQFRTYNNIFQLEPFWIRDDECEVVISDGWNNLNSDCLVLEEKIQSCFFALQLWDQRRFRALPKQIKSNVSSSLCSELMTIGTMKWIESRNLKSRLKSLVLRRNCIGDKAVEWIG